MSSDRAATFIFAGGGSGGHIFPAIAIAEQIAALNPNAEFRFLCSRRAIDAEVLTATRVAGEPVKFDALAAQPPGLRPMAMARFLGGWGPSLRATRQIIREARADRRPVQLISTGGFVAAPAAQAAYVERAPVTLVNLDAAPGRANRWIARRAGQIFSSTPLAPGAVLPRPVVFVPPIVRSEATTARSAAECRAALGLDPARPTLLITGASQGATSINRFIARFASAHAATLRRDGWQIIHQTGATRAPDGSPSNSEINELRRHYAELGIAANVATFFQNMGMCWRAAELAVSRAGAGSVAEAWCNQVPALFLPYPFHRDQHQRLNVAPLVDRLAAAVATDRVDPEANMASNANSLLVLLSDAERRSAMRQALVALGPADGAKRIACAVIALTAR